MDFYGYLREYANEVSPLTRTSKKAVQTYEHKLPPKNGALITRRLRTAVRISCFHDRIDHSINENLYRYLAPCIRVYLLHECGISTETITYIPDVSANQELLSVDVRKACDTIADTTAGADRMRGTLSYGIHDGHIPSSLRNYTPRKVAVFTDTYTNKANEHGSLTDDESAALEAMKRLGHFNDTKGDISLIRNIARHSEILRKDRVLALKITKQFPSVINKAFDPVFTKRLKKTPMRDIPLLARKCFAYNRMT